MKVTIIPSDTWVAVDGVGYNGVDVSSMPDDIHAVQFDGSIGWIEYVAPFDGVQPSNTQIDSLDQFQAVLDSWAEIDYEHKNPPPPPPPPPPTAEENKAYASSLLEDTDWTQIPSVSDPAQSSPYLANSAEFATYRSIVREVAVNPTAGFIDWPTKPTAVWV